MIKSEIRRITLTSCLLLKIEFKCCSPMLIIKLEDSGNLGYRVNEKICFDLDARLDFIIMIKKLMVKHNEHSLIKVLNTNFIFDHEYI